MKHAQTIAIARGLLADGRPTDVARMIEPLLAPSAGDNGASPPSSDPGEVMLRALLVRVRLLRYGDARRALDLLAAFDDSTGREALPPAVRAEVALWLGWAHAWPNRATFDEGRALHLFTEADRLFQDTLNTGGRCWVALGRAQSYLNIDEMPLLCKVTQVAGELHDTVQDAQAELVLTQLQIEAARFHGHDARALAHADRLTLLGYQYQDPLAEGSGYAYQALARLSLGRGTEAAFDAARQAETLLTRSIVHAGRPLLHAYEAQVRALSRQGRWAEADRVLERAVQALKPLPNASEHVAERRIALALHREEPDAVRPQIDDLLARVHRLPSRRQEARVLLLKARSLPDAPDQADDLAARALDLAHDCGDERLQLSAWLTRARIWADAGQEDTSRRHLRQAEPFEDYFSLLPFAARRFHLLGHLAQEDRPTDATVFWRLAHAAYRLLGDEPAQDRVNTDLDAAPPASGPPTLASMLAHAAVSVPLVAQIWLDQIAAEVPARWLGIYQHTTLGTWQLLCQHGPPPPDLTGPPPERTAPTGDDLAWVRLQTGPEPAFYLGVWLDQTDATRTLHDHVAQWQPVLRLALDHAVLRARQLDTIYPHVPVDDAARTLPETGVVYGSPAMRAVAQTLVQARNSHCPVLLTGEQGTGKEHLARALHRLSERREAPFIVFDGATLTTDMVEQTLFGPTARNGHADAPLFLQADGGTLYIREVADLPRDVQTRLLQYLETGEVLLPRARQPHTPDVRIVAATSRAIPERIRAGRFHEPLYFRLGVLQIPVPPLRERREDIPLLARHFLKAMQTPGTPLASITSRALEALTRYAWPGNVRQLRNELERALTAVRSEPAPMIDHAALSPVLQDAAEPEAPSAPEETAWADLVLTPGQSLDDVLARAEKTIIERVLTEHDGQVSASAQALGLTRQGLYKKMKRLTIDASAFQTTPEPDAPVAVS